MSLMLTQSPPGLPSRLAWLLGALMPPPTFRNPNVSGFPALVSSGDDVCPRTSLAEGRRAVDGEPVTDRGAVDPRVSKISSTVRSRRSDSTHEVCDPQGAAIES